MHYFYEVCRTVAGKLYGSVHAYNLFHLLTIQVFNIKDLKSLVSLLHDLVNYFALEDAPISFPSAVILEIELNISFSTDGTQFEYDHSSRCYLCF